MTGNAVIPATAYRILWDTFNGLFDLDEETISPDELHGYCTAALPDLPAEERTWRGLSWPQRSSVPRVAPHTHAVQPRAAQPAADTPGVRESDAGIF